MNPPADPALPSLELEAVDVPSIGDPNQVVVRDVNWRVLNGENWLVAGAAGTGKSSVMSVAAGLMRPLRGRIRLFGAELANLNETEQVARRAKVGVVFGDGGRLFGHLTVAGNLELPLLYHSHRQDPRQVAGRVEETLTSLGLMAHIDRLPRELPRRIASRVALARALMLRPEVLLLDDPANGLGDEEASWWMQAARSGGGGEGPRTLIIASDELAPWATLANRFAAVANRSWHVVEDVPALAQWLRPETAD